MSPERFMNIGMVGAAGTFTQDWIGDISSQPRVITQDWIGDISSQPMVSHRNGNGYIVSI